VPKNFFYAGASTTAMITLNSHYHNLNCFYFKERLALNFGPANHFIEAIRKAESVKSFLALTPPVSSYTPCSLGISVQEKAAASQQAQA
jgi:hypothetical protein